MDDKQSLPLQKSFKNYSKQNVENTTIFLKEKTFDIFDLRF